MEASCRRRAVGSGPPAEPDSPAESGSRAAALPRGPCCCGVGEVKHGLRIGRKTELQYTDTGPLLRTGSEGGENFPQSEVGDELQRTSSKSVSTRHSPRISKESMISGAGESWKGGEADMASQELRRLNSKSAPIAQPSARVSKDITSGVGKSSKGGEHEMISPEIRRSNSKNGTITRHSARISLDMITDLPWRPVPFAQPGQEVPLRGREGLR